MSLKLIIKPPYTEQETTVRLEGEAEELCYTILTNRLLGLDHEIWVEDSSGELIPYEDFIYEP